MDGFMKVKVLVAQSCPTLCDSMDCCSQALYPWHFASKNTGVGSHSLLQGIFLTQGRNPGKGSQTVQAVRCVCLHSLVWMIRGMNEAGRKKLPNDSLTGLLVSVV